MPSEHSVPLPRGWPKHIKSGLLHAISLAAMALTVARSRHTQLGLQTELDRANGEIALLKEELAIKEGRWGRLPSRRRPHFTPIQRMRILQNSLDQYTGVDRSTILWYIFSVKISLEKVESLCRRQGMSVGIMLREAGVSRNAFYTLARKDSVVPQSLIRISERLGVSVSALLDDVLTPAQRMKCLIAESNRIAKRHRRVDRDNVRHTLLLLEEKPIERLRRALRRGRPVNLR